MEKIINKRNIFIAVLIGVLIVGTIWFYFYKDNDTMLIIDDADEDILSSEENNSEITPTEKEQSHQIMVHIVGQVKNPGVAILTEGERLIDALDKLGGPLEEADLERVNLSQKLRDEEKIYIPKIGEEIIDSDNNTSTNSSQEQDDGKININTADQSQLKTLPGIGDALSSRIIEYRKTHGEFKSIEEIKEVERIGEKVFNELKEKIKI